MEDQQDRAGAYDESAVHNTPRLRPRVLQGQPMTPADLAAYQQVCEAATPGEWTLSTKHKSILLDKDGKQFAIIKHMLLQDRKFIATFNPAVVRRLLEVVARQREALINIGLCQAQRLGHDVSKLDFERGCAHCEQQVRAALAQDAQP